MKILDPIPESRILSLLLTLQCTAECANCGTSSSPRVKVRLEEDRARALIEEAALEGYNLVAFTGGEPMLYGRRLFNLISLAKSRGLSTRLVSNAFWAISPQRAERIVARLKDSGLTEINFSTGDQHSRFVPVVNVIHAIRAALDQKMRVAVMIETTALSRITTESIRTHPKFIEQIGEEDSFRVCFCESPWMPLSPHELEEYPPGVAINSENLDRRTGCDSIINTSTVLADGRIMACCGLGTQGIPELEVGHVGEMSLQTAFDSTKEDFLMRWIRDEGPEKILAWAATKDPSIEWENQYAHRCQACKRLYSDEKVRTVLRKHHEEKMLDVLVSEWLMAGQIHIEA